MNFGKSVLINLAKPCVLIAIILMQESAFGWSEYVDCEGAPGKRATQFFSMTTYSNAQANSGNTSCRMGIRKGTDGWGEWGGVIDFPKALRAGEELWARVNLFVPNDFDYTASPQLKFMRVHTRSPGHDNMGYLDFLVTPDGPTHWDSGRNKQTNAPYYYYYETKVRQAFPGNYESDRIQKGKWESYEIYYKFDTRSVSEGGTGRVRIWKNNKLLADLPNQVTLKENSTEAHALFLFTYWNGPVPKTQYLFIDDIILTTSNPGKVDAKGNPYIGGSTGVANQELERNPIAPKGLQINRH